ncbi:hypothetical protein PIB30_047784 [Stylosanthes scabra]|uniref:Uncharacterized protein n=1 Tax=Stylosanthes scabra TaxID=79078 RepID=A0ABU6UJ11_9FABA|nr:hypothetical protein [Stylosanthes scabra]
MSPSTLNPMSSIPQATIPTLPTPIESNLQVPVDLSTQIEGTHTAPTGSIPISDIEITLPLDHPPSSTVIDTQNTHPMITRSKIGKPRPKALQGTIIPKDLGTS